ncbi:MAG: four helix bundle protein [Planctomycetaceae bacterium]
MPDDPSADSPSEDSPSSERKPFEKKGIFDKKLNDRPERFEDYPTWQEARRLTNRIYEITDQPAFAKDLTVRDEIRRLVVEVMTHLASAVESHGERGFVIGLGQAKASAAGLRSLAFVAVDRGYLTEQEQIELGGRAASLARSIGSQLFRLKRAETSDFKHKPGGFGTKPGGFGAKKPYGAGPGGPKKPYGSGPGGPKKPYRPKRDE